MKQLTTVSLCFILLLSACYSTKYTHSQVIENAVIGKSKNQIIEQFGFPDQKKTQENFEEWYYDLGNGTVAISMPAFNDSLNFSPLTMDSRGYNNSMTLTFSGDLVTSWNTSGLDYTQKKISVWKTTIAAIGATFVAAIPVFFILVTFVN